MDSSMQELYKNSSMALIQAKKRKSATGDSAFIDSAGRVLDFMCKIWKEQKLCDVLITCNGGYIQAHRVVLGAYSDTLNSTFQGYKSGDMVKLDLTDFRSEVVMAILEFFYSAELELNCHTIGQNRDNFNSLVCRKPEKVGNHWRIRIREVPSVLEESQILACANELGVEIVRQACLDYLNAVDVNNAILHYSIAENNGLNDVRDKAFFFILDNFPEVSFTRHFLYLPFERILRIVKDKNLCLKSELDVFSGIVRWVDFDASQRQKPGYQLLQHVNFENLPPQSLVKEVETVAWIINDPECVKNFLYKAMKYNALKGEGSPLADANTPKERICLKEPAEEQRFFNGSDGSVGPARPSNSQDRELSIHFRRSKRHDHEESLPNREPDRYDEPWNSNEFESIYGNSMAQDDEPQRWRKLSLGQKTRNMQQRSSNNISSVVQVQSLSSLSAGSVCLPSPSGALTQRESPPLQKRREPLKRQLVNVKQSQSSDVKETRQQSLKSGELSSKRKKYSPGQAPLQQSLQQASPLESLSPRGRQPPCIVAVGGIDLNSIDPDVPGKNMFSYDSQFNRWTMLPVPMKKYVHHHGAGVIYGKLFVVGGSVYNSHRPGDLGTATNELLVFDPDTQKWYQAASMIYSRAYAGVAVWKNKLLVVGGEDSNKQKLDTIECYDPLVNNWAVLTQMPGGAKVGASAAVFLDCLFVVGGYNKDREYEPVLADVECYDLLSQRWTILSPLTFPRCHASLIEMKRRLFLIGGRSANTKRHGETSLSFVEEYDPSNDTWKRIANMEIPRHDAGCAAVGSTLYILGGMRSPNNDCLQSVECFNIVSGTWVKGVEDFPCPVAGMHAVSLPAPNKKSSDLLDWLV